MQFSLLIRDLWDDKHHAVDSDVSIKIEFWKFDQFEQSVSIWRTTPILCEQSNWEIGYPVSWPEVLYVSTTFGQEKYSDVFGTQHEHQSLNVGLIANNLPDHISRWLKNTLDHK